jgi:U3 small nucleolar RNA-associated protein 20
MTSLPLQSCTGADLKRIARVMDLLTVACSVRAGSRIGIKHLATILSQLQNVPLVEDVHESFLKLSVACLIAGDMGLWMGIGRKVFERTWTERSQLALQITGGTLELGWGAWQMIALPHLIKRSLDLLEKDQSVMQVLEVLSAAQQGGKLKGVDEMWKERLRKWVFQRFRTWHGSDNQVCLRNNKFIIGQGSLS